MTEFTDKAIAEDALLPLGSHQDKSLKDNVMFVILARF